MQEFSHSIYLDAAIDEVYKYAAAASGIIKWFIGECDYFDKDGNIIDKARPAVKGNKFRWKWLAKDLEIYGEVLESKENDTFGFTFGSNFNVTINLSISSGRTRLDLLQKYNKNSVKNDFAHINCCVCWVFFLTNLKSVIEHGIDLRETASDDEALVNR